MNLSSSCKPVVIFWCLFCSDIQRYTVPCSEMQQANWGSKSTMLKDGFSGCENLHILLNELSVPQSNAIVNGWMLLASELGHWPPSIEEERISDSPSRLMRRIASVFPNIFRVWREQGWSTPVITEQLEPEQTILCLAFAKIGDKRSAIRSRR